MYLVLKRLLKYYKLLRNFSNSIVTKKISYNSGPIKHYLTRHLFPGSRWVGWNKTMMMPDEEVTLTFNFSETRLFYHIDIHTNNMFTKDVQVTPRLFHALATALAISFRIGSLC